jgi:hypothetical protein
VRIVDAGVEIVMVEMDADALRWRRVQIGGAGRTCFVRRFYHWWTTLISIVKTSRWKLFVAF